MTLSAVLGTSPSNYTWYGGEPPLLSRGVTLHTLPCPVLVILPTNVGLKRARIIGLEELSLMARIRLEARVIEASGQTHFVYQRTTLTIPSIHDYTTH